MEFPEPHSQRGIRELLTGLQTAHANGELVSITVTLELASGEMSFVRTPAENDYALAGFMIATANDILAEKFYDNEIIDASHEDDDDEEDEEIGDPE
jgi:hypothetical protein